MLWVPPADSSSALHSPRWMRAITLLVLTVTFLANIVVVRTQAPPTLRVRVFLVDSDLNVKPVPRHVLTLRRESVGEPAIHLTTDLKGRADAAPEPGTYILESSQAVDFQGRSYRWKQNVTVKAGESQTIDLSVDTAVVEVVGQPGKATADLPALFKAWQGSVVTVWGEAGQGSGFMIDPRGLILTNQHIVGLSDYAAVQFDETLKVPATIVSRSPDKDVAVLWINPMFVAGVKPVQIAYAQPGVPSVVEGQQVFTIGSPLSLRKIMTTGIVSKVEARVIISDVNINHGNSGGPLFTAGGAVVGITTFGDFTPQGGPGLSGIVRIDEAREAIAEAGRALSGPAPSEATLPVEPAQAFPLDGLKDVLRARPVRGDDYAIGASDFNVGFITPVLLYGTQVAREQAALSEKAKRNSKPQSAPDFVDPFVQFKSWAEYVGEYRAVLLINAQPKLVAGFMSALTGGLVQTPNGFAAPAQLHFKADFSRMKLYCGGREVTPIHPGKVQERMAVNTASAQVNDVTYEGLYTYPADAISPNCGSVRLELFNEKEPLKADARTLPAKLIQRLWDDFEPFRAVQNAVQK